MGWLPPGWKHLHLQQRLPYFRKRIFHLQLHSNLKNCCLLIGSSVPVFPYPLYLLAVVIARFLVPGDGCSVTDSDDRALFIGTIHMNIHGFQLVHHIFIRMSVLVILPQLITAYSGTVAWRKSQLVAVQNRDVPEPVHRKRGQCRIHTWLFHWCFPHLR